MKFTDAVVSPLHNVWLAMVATVGVGSTVIVNVCAAPVHPLAAGVTFTTAVVMTLPLFTAVNDAILPVPVAASPIVVFVLVQL